MPTTITLILSDENNKKVEMYKAAHELANKEDAINRMIEELAFEVKVNE